MIFMAREFSEEDSRDKRAATPVVTTELDIIKNFKRSIYHKYFVVDMASIAVLAKGHC